MSVFQPIGLSREHDNLTETLFQSFFAEGPREQFRNGQGRPLFDVVRPAFLLQTAELPALQRA